MLVETASLLILSTGILLFRLSTTHQILHRTAFETPSIDHFLVLPSSRNLPLLLLTQSNRIFFQSQENIS
ncbi:hypothetical protein A4A49_39310 [Nicotiana attenuata]|uniref:Uncharacterized protein n=1 Tax=Nicotiana attenuata TaxID=49451 RepID=A0A1J6JV70_NICAT|nr:hypothetical protein A4A49_39310 [Nicotiana attenuata]